MTAIAIIADILFAAFVLTAIVGTHLWAISSSRAGQTAEAPVRTVLTGRSRAPRQRSAARSIAVQSQR